jgi:hypothetical protein
MVMSRHLRNLILLAGLLVTISVYAGDDEVRAEAAVSLEQNRDVWAGQQITVNLDLKTTGFSFSDSHFNLPEVGGAFLMQTDTTTIKLTENIDGRTWQVVRYPLALYPQKAGTVEIPPINVRFNTSAGFGSAQKAFEFQTRALELAVNLPPGVKPGDLVVTTTSFELEYNWLPESAEAKTGDAFTLTVKRRAADISAMMLPPLPVFQADGLAAYPQTPEVVDRTDRGDLTGERIDTLIWIAEKPGTYEVPGIRFQWWDPLRRELRQQIVPSLKFDILPSEPGSSVTVPAVKAEQGAHSLLPWSIIMLAGLLSVGLWLGFRQKFRDGSLNNEKTAFANLQQACKNNQANQAYAAIHSWLSNSSTLEVKRPVTLKEFAGMFNNKQLDTELERLQDALVDPGKEWNGAALLKSLQDIRTIIRNRKTIQSRTYLAPLNP